MSEIVLDYLRTHRANGAEISRALGLASVQVYAAIARLDADGRIVADKHWPRVYWRAA